MSECGTPGAMKESGMELGVTSMYILLGFHIVLLSNKGLIVIITLYCVLGPQFNYHVNVITSHKIRRSLEWTALSDSDKRQLELDLIQ